MTYKRLAAGIALLGACLATAAQAEDDLGALKREIQTLKQDYQSRILALEKRLREAESQRKTAAPAPLNAAGRPVAVPPLTSPPASDAAQAPAGAPSTQTVEVPPIKSTLPAPDASAVEVPAVTQPAPGGARASPGQNAFNPGVAAVLNGFLAGSRRDPAAQTISGFVMPDETGPLDRGFSLGESEIALFANIDPYVKGWLTLAFDKDNEASVEEAYIQSLNLGGGLNVKAGRFFSGIGYLNERHAHEWQFSDAPLPYRVFLGNQYGDDGVQLRWLLPLPFYLEAGAEWFRGDAFPASGAADGGKGTYAGFLHFGSDITTSLSWYGGLSYLHGRAKDRADGADTFTGRDDLAIANLIFKYAPNGNFARGKIILTGEYIYDATKGEFDFVPVDLKRGGFYAQGTYQFRRRWTIGARYARLETDDVPLTLAGSTLDAGGHTPETITGLLEFDTSEFGRLRFQYTNDRSSRQANDQFLLQYTVIYGPHPAHRY
ncbi:MAG: hypothetical protein U1E87_05800 [Alphaproteobacteria bacterium]